MTPNLLRHIVPLAAVVATAACLLAANAGAQSQQARAVPTFAVDASWPKVPPQWKLGDASSVAVDAQDNVYVLHRPRTLKPEDAAKAAPPVMVFDAAGQFRQVLGRPGQRLRVARARARHPHRPQGLRLDRRQQLPDLRHRGPEAGRRRRAPEVHARRQVRPADRQEQPEQGRRRHRERASRGGCLGASAQQRAVRGRRLRQSPRHRVRRRHRRVQADLGRLRQAARRRGQLRDRRPQDLSPMARVRRTSTSRTPSASPTTAWCISPTARTAACRCLRATASS